MLLAVNLAGLAFLVRSIGVQRGVVACVLPVVSMLPVLDYAPHAPMLASALVVVAYGCAVRGWIAAASTLFALCSFVRPELTLAFVAAVAVGTWSRFRERARPLVLLRSFALPMTVFATGLILVGNPLSCASFTL